MTPLDSIVAIALVALCAHVGILLVALARGLVPQRRHPDRTAALAAGLCALVGELLALRALIGRPAPLPWVGGLLALGLLLGIVARGAWREHPVGRAAFHAALAPAVVLVFVGALALRSG